jgi:hypothetical protein
MRDIADGSETNTWKRGISLERRVRARKVMVFSAFQAAKRP